MEQYCRFNSTAYRRYMLPRVAWYLFGCALFDAAFILYYIAAWSGMTEDMGCGFPYGDVLLLLLFTTVLMKLPAFLFYFGKQKWRRQDTFLVTESRVVYRYLSVVRKDIGKKYYLHFTFDGIDALKRRNNGTIVVKGQIPAVLYDDAGQPCKGSAIYYDVEWQERIMHRVVIPPYYDGMQEVYAVLGQIMKHKGSDSYDINL